MLTAKKRSKWNPEELCYIAWMLPEEGPASLALKFNHTSEEIEAMYISMYVVKILAEKQIGKTPSPLECANALIGLGPEFDEELDGLIKRAYPVFEKEFGKWKGSSKYSVN